MDARRLLAGLGRRTRELRAERGLTLRELAERSGLSPRYLVQVESGRGNISVGRLADLAGALGTTPAALLSGSPVEPDVPVAYTGEDDGNTVTVTRRLVQITVSVEILDQRDGKPLWQRNGLLLEGDYEPGQELRGRERALEKLVTNIVEGAQSQW